MTLAGSGKGRERSIFQYTIHELKIFKVTRLEPISISVPNWCPHKMELWSYIFYLMEKTYYKCMIIMHVANVLANMFSRCISIEQKYSVYRESFKATCPPPIVVNTVSQNEIQNFICSMTGSHVTYK